MVNPFYYLNYLISKGIEQAQIIEIKLDKIDYIKYRNPFYLYKQINKTITLNKNIIINMQNFI